MNFREVSEEVVYGAAEPVIVGRPEIAFLEARAAGTRRGRARLCSHADPGDPMHEMFIVHPRGAYVRPHKHLQKLESFHLIAGAADLILFDEQGAVSEVIPLGDYASGSPFYCRIPSACYHSLVIRSERLIFHETTTGPFRPEETLFAPWSPPEGAPEVAAYLALLGACPPMQRAPEEP